MPLSKDLIPDLNKQPISAQQIQESKEIELLKKVLENPELRQQAEKIIKEKTNEEHRQPGHSYLSVSPYYKEEHAIDVKVVLDEMIKTGEDYIFYYRDFPTMSPRTVYSKINQGLKYLLNCLDTPDHKYANFCRQVSVTRPPPYNGIRFSFRKENESRGNTVKALRADGSWRIRLDNFIETSKKGDKHTESGLILSEAEQIDLAGELDGLENFMYSYVGDTLKMVRIKE